MVAELASSTEYLPLDQVIHGDALDVLKTFPENSIDALVVDPPAGVSFMNRAFDHDKGGRHQWVAWLHPLEEVLAWQEPPRHLNTTNTSGYRGVTRIKRSGKWQASYRHDEKLLHLGTYGSPEVAARAYDRKAIEIKGRDALTNFPIEDYEAS